MCVCVSVRVSVPVCVCEKICMFRMVKNKFEEVVVCITKTTKEAFILFSFVLPVFSWYHGVMNSKEVFIIALSNL